MDFVMITQCIIVIWLESLEALNRDDEMVRTTRVIKWMDSM